MNKFIVSAVISSALITGCASNKVTEEKYSGFLNDYSLLSKATVQDKDTMGYVAPGINWQKYNSVMIDKVRIFNPEGEVQNKSQLLTDIAEKYEELLRQKISKRAKVVDQPGPGVIRLQTAITSVYASYDDFRGYQYIPIAAAVTGGARATGVEKKSARMMSELRIVDSLDGQLLGQAVDLKTGETRQDEDEGVQLADVVPILEQWSTRAVERVRGLRSKVKK
jgi:hypothetical protein